MKAFVTGGGGFLGSAITRALLARGDEVTTFARGAYPDIEASGAAHVRGDVTDADAVRVASRGHDVIFHVAALVKIAGDAKDFDRINVDGTANVIAACRANDISTLVFTSTPSVVHDGFDAHGIDETKPYPATFLCDYFRTKAVAEEMVLKANDSTTTNGSLLKTTSLRPHGVFGPGDTSLLPLLVARAKKGRLRKIGNGDTKVDWCFVDTAVSAHLKAAERLQTPPFSPAGKAYFIANDAPGNPWDFFNVVLGRLGLPTVDRSVPMGVAMTMGSVAEKTWSLFGLKGEPPGTRAMASVLGTSHWFDLSAARRDLGWAPEVSMDDAVERTIPYLRQMLDDGKL